MGLYGLLAAVICAVAVILNGVVLCLSSLSGVAAAAGPQAAAQRPTHQTCPEDHEVPAAPQGEKQNTAVLLITHQHLYIYIHTHILVFTVQLSHTQQVQSQGCKHTSAHTQTHTHAPLCVETLTTHRWHCLLRLLSSQRGRGKLHNETPFLPEDLNNHT